MFEKMKDSVNEKKANLYLEMLLDSFYKDYNRKAMRRENTLNCEGTLTLDIKKLNPDIIYKLYMKASEIGAEISDQSYQNFVFLTLREEGRGVKHTLKI